MPPPTGFTHLHNINYFKDIRASTTGNLRGSQDVAIIENKGFFLMGKVLQMRCVHTVGPPRRRRIYYVGMIATEAFGLKVGERMYSGAAAHKMTSITRVLRGLGHRAIIVSSTRAKCVAHGSVAMANRGVIIVFLARLQTKYLRRVLRSLTLAGFFWRHSLPGDTAIIYTDYRISLGHIPMLFLLRLRGVKIIQDIEDAPMDDGKPILSCWAFAVASRISASKKMVVSENVAKNLKLDDYVVIRGCVAPRETILDQQVIVDKWQDLHDGGDLRLHYGGMLIRETGIDLFCEAVGLIVHREERLDRKVTFKITGVGELEKVRSLQARVRDSTRVVVDVLPELNRVDYLAVFETCHGSLSLRDPGSGYSDTTFPSKIIEITASGLALLSTLHGDVATLFDHRSTFFLSTYDASDLADIVLKMTCNPGQVERIAAVGRDVCMRNFSEETVSHELSKLL